MGRRRTRSAREGLCLVLLLGCSGEGAGPGENSGDDACPDYCDYAVDCTPGWMEAGRGETACSWKFGPEEAHDRCLTSCELAARVEDQTSEERRQCLECVVEAVGNSCLGPTAASADCPCVFETLNYAELALPDIEPLTCDSGDVYIFTDDPEEGEQVRQWCLDGDQRYCD